MAVTYVLYPLKLKRAKKQLNFKLFFASDHSRFSIVMIKYVS